MFGTIVVLLLILLSVIFALFIYKKFFFEEERYIYDKEDDFCGQEEVLINQRYFNIVILFLIFLGETVLLYPFALALEQLTVYVVIEAFILSVLIILALFYALKNGFLKTNDD